MKNDLTKSKAERDSKIQEIAILTQEIESGDTEKQKLITNIQETTLQLAQKEEELNKLNKSSEKKLNNSQKSLTELEIVKKDIDYNKKILREFQQKLLVAENEEKKLFENKGKTSEILKAKLDKRLNVHGRLGDLGQINPIYDIAVSSAFPQLDSFVVDTVAQATELFTFVREKGLGRTNVIVLEKCDINEHQMNNFRSPDPCAIRIFDKINITDNRLKPAFYLTFGDTLFTEKIDDARRIAFGERRCKVVTKDGDIINPSGEMRGFSRPTGGKMKLVGSQSAVVKSIDTQEVKREAKQITEIIEQLTLKQNALESEIQNEKISDRQIRQQINILQNDISTKQERIKSDKERLNILNQRTSDDMKLQIQKAQMLVEKAENVIKKLEKLIEQKNSDIAELENQVEKVGGEQYKLLKEELKRLQADEDRLDKELSKAQANLKQSKKDFEKYTLQLKKSEEEATNLKEKYEKMRKEKEERTKKAESAADELFRINKAIEEQEKLISSLQEQQDFIKKQFDEILKSRNEVKQIRKDLQDRLQSVEIEVRRWESKLEGAIKDYHNLINEYSGLLTGMIIEEQPIQNTQHIEHQSRKHKNQEERINLRRPINWEASEEELLQLLQKMKTIEEIEREIESELTDRPNLNVIEDYKNRLQEKNQKETLLNEAKLQETELKTLYTDYKNRRLTEFTRGFREISNKLREMYRLLTRGGDAELELADSTDPFSEGIVFTVRPPSKSWKKMANLSGGEKTLSSLALVFALHHYKPNCLYVMDEVDAALDFQNVSVIAGYIKGQTKNAQFIVVSLRYQMFEVADQLVGIYKTKDVSKSLCISPYSLKEIHSDNPIIVQTIANIALRGN